MYFSFEPLLTKCSRNYRDDACTSHSGARGPHGTSEHSSRPWSLAHQPFQVNDFLDRGLCCCPFHNARDWDNAIYYQDLLCLSWSLSSRFVGKKSYYKWHAVKKRSPNKPKKSPSAWPPCGALRCRKEYNQSNVAQYCGKNISILLIIR